MDKSPSLVSTTPKKLNTKRKKPVKDKKEYDEKVEEKETITEKKGETIYELKSQFADDLEAHDNYITDFDAYEAMLIGEVWDSVSKSVKKSSITDSYAATLAIE